jgi:hypothetical protein
VLPLTKHSLDEVRAMVRKKRQDDAEIIVKCLDREMRLTAERDFYRARYEAAVMIAENIEASQGPSGIGGTITGIEEFSAFGHAGAVAQCEAFLDLSALAEKQFLATTFGSKIDISRRLVEENSSQAAEPAKKVEA